MKMRKWKGALLPLALVTMASLPSVSRAENAGDPEEYQVTIPAEISSEGIGAENTWLKKKLIELQRRIARPTDSNNAVPTPVRMKGRSVELNWLDTQGETRSWKLPVDSYRSVLARDKPKGHVLLRGETRRYRVVDFRPFVEPEPFRQLAEDMYERAGSDEAYLDEVLAMVSQLTIYTRDTVETPRWPLETLVENGGDCEDTSILIASLLKASGRPYKVDFVYFDVKNPKSARKVNHVALRVTTPAGYSRLVESTAKIGDRNYTDMPQVVGWYVAAN